MHTKESLVAFEQRIKAHFAEGELPFLVHLSGGNEEQLLELFGKRIRPDDWVFSNHRSHYHALLKGIPEYQVEAAILRGDSMFIFDRERRFYTSSILAGTCCIAAGVALAIKESGLDEQVWCFLGDGAEDNGHFCEAVRFAEARELPITFVIEDNDRQVDTTFLERWQTSWRWQWPSSRVIRYSYTPTFPHGGAGLPAGSVKFKQSAIERFKCSQRY
jgi:pyruvate dehydrogenase E1 component alpha subunit